MVRKKNKSKTTSKKTEKKSLLSKTDYLFISIALLLVVMDQLTKYLASAAQSKIVIENIFHLTLVHNYGASFGILQNFTWFLTVFSFVIIGFILYYYYKKKVEKNMVPYVAMVLAGTIGNLIDRLRFGYVIDFIDFRVWPSFNIADAAITIGVIGLVIILWKQKD